MTTTAIWWVRRDLRLSDNQALTAALDDADQVIPTFVIDPALLDSPYTGPKRIAFLWDGLRQLDADLRERGSRLIVRTGRPLEVLATLIDETSAGTIFAEEDYSPYARRRDQKVQEELSLKFAGRPVVRHPDDVLKDNGDPYIVYTPYSKKWKKSLHDIDPLPAPGEISTPSGVDSESIPDEPSLPDSVPFESGEAEAQRRLREFTRGDNPPVYGYGDKRNRMDLDATSRLSPYLRFGMLSARQAIAAAREAIAAAPNKSARKGAETWLNELIWREFYVSILYHFPEVREHEFREDYRSMAWEYDEEAFEAWCAGRTGYPIVDAAMRQLKESGWMHNRGRMIVASFLVKDMLIDWRWGERWFMQHLVDGDPAANNGGWQWTAGTGTDAAPYFRIFNPILQGKKHDPDGQYIRHWVPELGQVPDKYLHEPWEMPVNVQEDVGCVIGDDYPAPIVDHYAARERTLEAYAQARGDDSDER